MTPNLADSQTLGVGEFFALEERLVNPSLGWADGGQNEWGRRYPNGGILDPATGQWSSLPKGPSGRDEWSAGVTAAGQVHYVGDHGWLLDLDTRSWTDVPDRPGSGDADLSDEAAAQTVTGDAVAAAGQSLLVFGGVRWPHGTFRGELLADAWLWTP